ncbi:MAG: hypothetical protein WA400_11710, partial [Silvibacterium sp.]
GQTRSNLDFLPLMMVEEGHARRIDFHDLHQKASGGDGPLRERLCALPEGRRVSVSALSKQRG